MEIFPPYSQSYETFELDLVARNKQEEIVIVAQLKANTGSQHYALMYLQQVAEAIKLSIPFWMVVDLEKIKIFKLNPEKKLEPVLTLNTSEILSYYEQNFSTKRIFHYYLTGLLQLWLNDFQYNWKMKSPPASQEVAEIGLLPLLIGGDTQVNFLLKP